MDAAIIRQGELVGRGVMAYETTEAVGTVEHLLVDVARSHAVGFSCKAPGLLPRKQVLSWKQLVKIGRDSLVVHAESPSEMPAELDSALAAAQNMTDLEVWTDGGDHIGRIVDLCLNEKTGEVQQYLFALYAAPVDSSTNSPGEQQTSSGDADLDEAEERRLGPTPVTVYEIVPAAIISAGRKRMMIAEEDAQRSHPYSQQLEVTAVPTTAERRLDWTPENLPEIPTDFGDLLQKGQSFAGKVSQQVRERAKQFTDEKLAQQDFVEGDSLPDITEQLQAKTAQVKQQMQQQMNKAKEKAQHQLDERLGESSQENFRSRIENTPIGRSLGQAFDKFKRPQPADKSDPIDVDSFEVWEDD